MVKQSTISEPNVIFTPYMMGDYYTELFKKVQQADEQAYELIFKHYYSRLCHFACGILTDLDDAEEAVQQTFITLWDKKENIHIETSIQAYLYRAVKNTCINRIKQQQVHSMHHNSIKHERVESVESTQEAVMSNELRNSINDAIEMLPEQCRLVFTLSRYEGMKHQEIANELNISIKTVENQIGKALKHMRVQLKEYLTFIVLFISFQNII